MRVAGERKGTTGGERYLSVVVCTGMNTETGKIQKKNTKRPRWTRALLCIAWESKGSNVTWNCITGIPSNHIDH
ncbi:hypothetical protein V6N13_087040 [Hibiscus sabdariffa]|uniref:Uncharacterized protein n=1 Tax=Hibiscus sabdariffa TaxID=183260 RepID=A0ABR2FVU4_9ROSI